MPDPRYKHPVFKLVTCVHVSEFSLYGGSESLICLLGEFLGNHLLYVSPVYTPIYMYFNKVRVLPTALIHQEAREIVRLSGGCDFIP